MKLRAYPALWLRVSFDILCIILVGIFVSSKVSNYRGDYNKLENIVGRWIDKAEDIIVRLIKFIAGDSWKEVEEWKILDC